MLERSLILKMKNSNNNRIIVKMVKIIKKKSKIKMKRNRSWNSKIVSKKVKNRLKIKTMKIISLILTRVKIKKVQHKLVLSCLFKHNQ